VNLSFDNLIRLCIMNHNRGVVPAWDTQTNIQTSKHTEWERFVINIQYQIATLWDECEQNWAE
jgi:hypothetical protein